jgi:hypothetical protein
MTEAMVTLAPNRVNVSVMHVVSISSDPSPMGTRTFFDMSRFVVKERTTRLVVVKARDNDCGLLTRRARERIARRLFLLLTNRTPMLLVAPLLLHVCMRALRIMHACHPIPAIPFTFTARSKDTLREMRVFEKIAHLFASHQPPSKSDMDVVVNESKNLLCLRRRARNDILLKHTLSSTLLTHTNQEHEAEDVSLSFYKPHHAQLGRYWDPLPVH